ncbi:MAG TPA: hypothetical protein VMU96_10395 [Casimicrobiaceae bacterium]|nr:hypothetical protein [Casimicrobiaceae bacterium]
MFKIRRRSHAPLRDARSAQRWLATLPFNDPLVVQREVLDALNATSDRTAQRTPSMLAAVFRVDAQTRGLVRTLMTQYTEIANRSPKLEGQLWRALFDLTQGFRACYAGFARETIDRGQHSRWLSMLAELIAREIAHLGRDAKLRRYRCERWIPAKWAELHALFMRACSHQLERQPLQLAHGAGATTIEREYLQVLLLDQADPGNMTPRQIEWLSQQLEDWCRPLRLTLEPQAAATFYVDLASGAGLKRRSVGPLEGRVLFVDSRTLHARLLQNRTELEQALKNQPRSDKTAPQRERLDLLVTLCSRLDPEFRPLARRGERIPTSGAVDAIVGFTNISGFLAEERTLGAAEFSGGRSFASAMDLATFGRSRSAQPDTRNEMVRRRLAAFAAPGGPWEMKDMSVSGFRLLAPTPVATEVKLSMLVAVHRRGESSWALGIVRRMRRLSADNAEIGLQLIANTLTAANLIEQRKAREGDYAVDGEYDPMAGRRFGALFLSYSRRAGEPPVRSLIIPPVEYQPSRRYTLQTPGSQLVIRYGRVLEQHHDWVWTVIEPLEVDGAVHTGSA